jgi:hypothetical protein
MIKFAELVALVQEHQKQELGKQRKERFARIAEELIERHEREKKVARIVRRILKEAQDNKCTIQNHNKAIEALNSLKG